MAEAGRDLGTIVVVVLKAVSADNETTFWSYACGFNKSTVNVFQRNLRDKHTFTKQDPFVSIQLGKTTKKTEIDKRGGQHPVWCVPFVLIRLWISAKMFLSFWSSITFPVTRDQDLHVTVPVSKSKGARTLKVSCFAKEPKEDNLIGAGEVDITEILKTGEFDGTY